MSRPSRARAVRAKCAECIADPESRGSEIRQITACSSTACPLFDVRPTVEVTEQELKWLRYETDERSSSVQLPVSLT